MSDLASTSPFTSSGSTSLNGLSSVNNNSQTTTMTLRGAATDLNPIVLPNQGSSASSASGVSSSSSSENIATTTPPITNTEAASVAAATAPAVKKEALENIQAHAKAQVNKILNSDTPDAKYKEVSDLQRYQLERINVESRMTSEQYTGPKKTQAAESAESKTAPGAGDASQPEKKSTWLYKVTFKEFYDVAIGIRTKPEEYEQVDTAMQKTDQDRKYTFKSIIYGDLPHVQRHLENGIKATNKEIRQIEKQAAEDALEGMASSHITSKGQSKKDVLNAFQSLPQPIQNKFRELAKLSVLEPHERAILNDPNAKVSSAMKKELEAKVEGRLLRLFGAKESTIEKMGRIGEEVWKKLSLLVSGIVGASLLPVFAAFSGIGIFLSSIDTPENISKEEYYGKVLEPTATINAYHIVRQFFNEVFTAPIRPAFAPFQDIG